jgi:hypothetical protein
MALGAVLDLGREMGCLVFQVHDSLECDLRVPDEAVVEGAEVRHLLLGIFEALLKPLDLLFEGLDSLFDSLLGGLFGRPITYRHD